jgi:hypothetical protein
MLYNSEETAVFPNSGFDEYECPLSGYHFGDADPAADRDERSDNEMRQELISGSQDGK